ncbi:hypothetical protein WME89_45035 [Sorangium sp. So ce321]|uniref:hypothetical protein n=1 Tax=Sorangium sp. So ce321 TaxID=3133300 RepID=UPI003F5EC251
MTIGLSAMACSADEIKDYIEDNMGEGGGDATSTTGSASSSSQSSTTAGTGGGTTSASTGEGGGTTTTASTGEGGGTTTTASTGEGGGGTTSASTGEGGGTTTGEGGGTTAAGTGGAGAGTGTGGSGSGGAPPVDPACGPDTATFADVRPVLEGCANQYCHGSPTAPSAGLDLRAAAAVGALVGQDASSCSSEHALVVPFMPSSSYLMNKLNDTGLCDPDESSMPPGAALPAADIKKINDWICAGAPAD